MKKKRLIIGIFLSLFIIIGIICYISINKQETTDKVKSKRKKKAEQEEKIEPKINIFDTDSTERPIAVMINNLNKARPYQSGLQDAQIIYEIITEGGITRMMAVFKDKNLDRIGPIRSSRHYYLDYALENDAIYTHWGWSYKAESDIPALGVNNLNGLYGEGMYRDKNLLGRIDLEHTAITDTNSLKDAIKAKGYRTTYNSNDVKSELLFKYSVDEISLQPPESKEGEEVQTDSIIANNIVIPYSNYMTASYVYDIENKYYLRFANGIEHKDYITGEQYHFKNIIIQKVANHNMDNYGRQDLSNVGTGSGFYVTNGYARPITWEKSSRQGKTVYRYLDGTEIVLNDGNTFIQIEPIDQNPSITE